MKKKISVVMIAALIAGNSANAQITQSGQSLRTNMRTVTLVPFNLSETGIPISMRWGLDTAWPDETNMRRGISFIGADNLSVARASFQPSWLVEDGKLTSGQQDSLQMRLNLIQLAGKKMDIILNCDHEKLTTLYSVNNSANVDNWAALIDATTRATQALGWNVIAVAPFNEPDYTGWGEGSVYNFYNIAKKLRTTYANTFSENIAISGGNTLNDDNALTWFNTLKTYCNIGNTHQLAGSFDNYARFYQNLQDNGYIGLGDELHNVGEAIAGARYGMDMGIWWGFDGYARGEFSKATSNINPGDMIGYGEDRSSWTSAAVFRNKVENKVQAFLGSSERQATTRSYQFLSKDRDVYFDGRGPLREFVVTMPGGTGYQKGQTNAERIFEINYGADVPSHEINGTYNLMNKKTQRVLAPQNSNVTSGAGLTQKTYDKGAYQNWKITPVASTVGGDFSYYYIESAINGYEIDDTNWSLDEGTQPIVYPGGKGNLEQWYFKYEGDGYYRIFNRHSGLCLSAPFTGNNTRIVQQKENTGESGQLWRIIPVDAACEIVAPAKPAGLKATAHNASILLDWTANAETDLDGYNVLRAEVGSNDWNTIARRVNGTSFLDNSVTAGTSYEYKIIALDKSDNRSETSDAVTATTVSEKGLIANYSFNNTLEDSTDNKMNAAFYGTEAYTAANKENTQALSLTNTTYAQLPYAIGNLDKLTITGWIKWDGTTTWQRIFDFGNGTDQYMFLTPNSGSSMRFVLKNGGDEQITETDKLTKGEWTYVSVTLDGNTARIYVNGEQKAENTTISIKPSDFAPIMNYLGRSQFESDPLFQGSIANLQIYNYALTAEEIKNLYDGKAVTGIDFATITTNNNIKAVYRQDGKKLSGVQKGVVNIIRYSNGTTRKINAK